VGVVIREEQLEIETTVIGNEEEKESVVLLSLLIINKRIIMVGKRKQIFIENHMS